MPGRTILVIDYDPQSVESTRQSLVEAGYRVEVATDGLEGLKAFERTRPDLVLIEPMVPKKHGFQVCREIKGSARGQNTPVLITTAFYKGRKHKAAAREHYGCDDYLEKPIAQSDLLAACRRWVEEPAASPVAAAPRAAWAANDSLALDDLTDDEIVARLDAMIDSATGAAEPASSPGPAPTPTPTPTIAPIAAAAVQTEPRTDLAPPAPAVAVAVAQVAPRPGPPAPASVAALTKAPRSTTRAAAPARAVQRPRPAEAALLASGTTRAIVAGTATAPPMPAIRATAGRRAIYAALVLVLAGGAVVAWMLLKSRPEPQAPLDVARGSTSADADSREESSVLRELAPAAPALLPSAAEPAPVEPPPAESATIPAHPVVEPTSAVRRDPIATAKPSPAPVAQAPEASGAEATSDGEPPAEPSVAPASEVGAVVAEPGEIAPDTATVEADLPIPSPAVEPGTLLELSEVDVAPVSIRKDPPIYPAIARSLRQQGIVTLRVLVDETGDVERVEVLRGIDGRVLDSAALRAARGWRYRPATEGGVPVKVWITEQVAFRL